MIWMTGMSRRTKITEMTRRTGLTGMTKGNTDDWDD